MTEYIFIDSGTDASALMFYDIQKRSNMKLIHEPYRLELAPFKFLCQLHNAYRINSKIYLPFRGIWNKYSSIGKIEKSKNYVIGFTNASVVKYDIDYLQKLSKLENVRLVLICLDPFFDRIRAPLEYIANVHFFKIYTFNEKDANNYGLELTKAYFSKCDLPKVQNEYDLYFVGAVKNRKSNINKLLNETIHHHCRYNFQLVDTSLTKNNPPYYSKRIPYRLVLDEINKSNCILEVVQEGQGNQTLRYFEAVVYNKKLLTNNPNIVNYPYYNERYMKIFNNPDDIDFEWVKFVETVDYNYKGDFSPVNFLEKCDFDG